MVSFRVRCSSHVYLANDVESLVRTDWEERSVRGKAVSLVDRGGPSLWVTLCSGAALFPCYNLFSPGFHECWLQWSVAAVVMCAKSLTKVPEQPINPLITSKVKVTGTSAYHQKKVLILVL